MHQTILQSWDGIWPNPRVIKPLDLGEGVLDRAGFNAIELDELFDTVNYASTLSGQTVLYRSLARPLSNHEAIATKQEALSELENNAELRVQLDQILNVAQTEESRLHLLLFGEFLGSMGTAREVHQIEGYGYKQYRRGVGCVLHLVEAIQNVAMPSSGYLQSVLKKITDFSQSNEYSLMVGPVYNSEHGLQSKEQRQASFSPATIFKPHLIKPLLIGLLIAAFWALSALVPMDFLSVSRDGLSIGSVFFLPLLLVYIPVVGGYDREHCIIPLRDIYRDSESLGVLLEGLGQLDELFCFLKYKENFGSKMVLPVMRDEETHFLALQDAKNPILGHRNPDYVGNDFEMQKYRLVFITGPNSGGKTAFCKTVTQIQVLAQTGCFVPAEVAEMAVADKIFYQAPEISHLDDGEGRFGTELKRTRDIFLATTSKSLVVLDEMAEGTTFEEKMQSSVDVLDGFNRKGNSTILITHNHQLVDIFKKRKACDAKQVEFAEDHPTFKLIAGISRVSHADRVAKKIGFSKQDIDNYLAQS